jgi:hypothetical protein
MASKDSQWVVMATLVGLVVALGSVGAWVTSVEVRFSGASDLRALADQIGGLRQELSGFREDIKSARIRMNKWEEVMLPILTDFKARKILEEKGLISSTCAPLPPTPPPPPPIAAPGKGTTKFTITVPSRSKIQKDAEKWAQSQFPKEEPREAEPAILADQQ